ncbi:MAG: YHS domain-containing protein [Candidatus Rokubacteria bacterium]|jgi:Cu+-exporting ATPase|nr:YHS domain-containing protein [Candidatus Rokubacteria bacterium]
MAAKDPVCGMQVEEKKAAATAAHKGTTYYFCAAACKTTFLKAPDKYVGEAKKG